MLKTTAGRSKLFTALFGTYFFAFSVFGIAQEGEQWNGYSYVSNGDGVNDYSQSGDCCDCSGDENAGCCTSCDYVQQFGDCCNNGCSDVRARYHDRALQTIECCDHGGIWLPEDPPLFRPFMADPREICYSAGWRFNDNALTKNIIDVSFGDIIGIYRWCDMWPWHGQLELALEACVWAVFDPCADSAPLINADYFVGVSLSYAIDRWQFRLRPFHISSHIGDEFLLNHPGFDRRNASNEYIDFFISHDLTPELRFYGGIGYIAREDESFHIKPVYGALGSELRLMRLGFYNEKDFIVGFPIFAMHFRFNGEYRKHVDSTYILGYQFSKLCGLGHNVRFFIEYHDGYSSEGQFCKDATNYFAIRGSYGY